MARALDGPGRPDLLIPIPTTRARVRRRGYNQAMLLARSLSKETGIPILDGLIREEGRRSQVALSPLARRSNTRGSFRLVPAPERTLEGRSILLVDDVLTTGATALAAAEVLGEGGISDAGLITFARSIPDLRG